MVGEDTQGTLTEPMLRKAVFLVLTALLVGTALAQSTPAPGSKLRRDVLDGLRPRVEADLKQKVKFEVSTLRVQGNWAFVIGRPLTPGGKRIDYRKTRYAQAVRDGVFDDGLSALLKREGTRWRVVRYALGATDVPWVEWPKETGAPASLFRLE